MMRYAIFGLLVTLVHSASLMDATSSAAGGGGCAAPQARRAGGIPLTMGVPPVLNIDPQYSFLNSKIAGEINGMGLFQSVQAMDSPSAGGVDLIATIEQPPGDAKLLPIVTVTSGRTGRVLYHKKMDYNFCGFVYYCIVPSSIGLDLAQAFASDGPLYQKVLDERRETGGVGERGKQLPSEDAQALIARAERAGDAAAAGGDAQKAFSSYVSALSGSWNDDDGSARIREKLMKLLVSYQAVPAVPEEARRHMVRAKAALKDSQGFSTYDFAAGEIMQAIGAAPWWTDAYYNLALVQEKQGYVDDAMSNLKFYLAGNPQGPDARAVQDKIYMLEMKQERGGR